MDESAVLRWRYATACGRALLHSLQAHQEPPVLTHEVDEKPPLSGQEGEHDGPADEAKQLCNRERFEEGKRTGPGSIVALPEDEASHDREGPIACERLPASRGGVQLPEAGAVRLAAMGQVVRDAHHEQREERQRSQSTPPSRGCG